MERLLSEKAFDILTLLADSDDSMTQRGIAESTGRSLGTINKTYNELIGEGYITDGRITEKGLASLEPYKVKRALFLAAGIGSRMMPITFNTPKPLVRVKGRRLIDGLIDACLAAGIDDITVVRGYLSEQFDQLQSKYPMIKFVENNNYIEANNIYSAALVRDLLPNAYVFECDLHLMNPSLIKKYHYQSNILAIKKERSDDWCFDVKDGFITTERVGGLNTWQMVGISYWTEEDGLRLAQDVMQAYEQPGGKGLFWEQVPLVVFNKKYKVRVRECFDEDVVELDTFNELRQADPTYNVK